MRGGGRVSRSSHKKKRVPPFVPLVTTVSVTAARGDGASARAARLAARADEAREAAVQVELQLRELAEARRVVVAHRLFRVAARTSRARY